MEIKDVILNLKVRLRKILLIPILGLIGFVIYSFLRGFGHNRYESTNPASMELGFPIWLVLILALFLFVLINIILKIYLSNNYNSNNQIHIKRNETIINTPTYRLIFKNKKSKYYKLTISRFWGLFFPTFYRVGKLKINYNGDKYLFLFPIRNMIDERKIKEKTF